MVEKIIYIDDDTKDLNKYRKIIEGTSSENGFEVITINAQSIDLSKGFNDLESLKPNLFLIDLDLSKPKNHAIFGLSGATTSTALREKFKDVPLILFTRKDIIRKRYPIVEQIASGMDEVIFKDELNKDLKRYVELFSELIKGYKTIFEKKPRKIDDIFTILDAPKVDFDLIKLANPPLNSNNIIPTYLAANWIRKVLLKYPGILYDPVHSAVFLGISEKGFLSSNIKEIFEKAKYSGVFSPNEGRWWKSGLYQLAIHYMEDTERNFTLREGFRLKWIKNNNMDNLDASNCVFSNESPAEWVCCILNKPMMIKYSLAYRMDSRPKIMDEARVSFKAIKTSNDFKDELLTDPDASSMLPRIKRLKPKGV